MRFQISRGNLGNINIFIMFYWDINKEKTEVSFGSVFLELSLNDAGISFQILAPTLEKTLFWRSSLDFLMWKLFDGGRPSSVRMNTISIAEYLSISYIVH